MDKADPLYLQATTACLAAIVMMQVMNLFLCRDPLKSSLASSLAANPLIPVGIAAELGVILAIVFTQAGNWLFGTAPDLTEVTTSPTCRSLGFEGSSLPG